MMRRYSDKESDIGVHIENLTVWTPEEYSWWRRRITKPKNVILNNVTGHLKHGQFVTILGPSGAGKTTLLVSLAGKCTLPTKGNVIINGTNVKAINKGAVEIMPQFEVFMESLSVMEHLVFMTEMKLGSCKNSRNQIALNTLISELKLKAHVNTPISALSGGERRLLSLATSLVSNPQIIICDEPTTGLDSSSASLVIEILKNMTLCGKLIICSVHQPSSDLFKVFDSILLMAEGRLLFHGSQEECKDLFESISLYCPKNYNPAEFYIRAVSKNPLTNENHTEKILDAYQSRILIENIRTETNLTRTEFKTDICMYRIQRHWLKQVHLLLWRTSQTVKRDTRELLIQLLVSIIISSMVIAVCYAGISGTTQRGVQDVNGFLWLISSEVCYSVSYNALFLFESQLTLFRREVGGVYSGSAYFVSMLLSSVPRCVIWPVACVTITALAVELPDHIVTAIKFLVSLILAAIASCAYGLGMGTLFTSTGIVGDVMPCMDLPLFLMSGAFLRVSSIPLWLYPVKYVSHFYYTLDAVSNIYWRQIDFIDCPTNATACYKDGTTVLRENGYSEDFIIVDSVGLLLVTLMWSVFGYYGLKREEKKGYAY